MNQTDLTTTDIQSESWAGSSDEHSFSKVWHAGLRVLGLGPVLNPTVQDSVSILHIAVYGIPWVYSMRARVADTDTVFIARDVPGLRKGWAVGCARTGICLGRSWRYLHEAESFAQQVRDDARTCTVVPGALLFQDRASEYKENGARLPGTPGSLHKVGWSDSAWYWTHVESAGKTIDCPVTQIDHVIQAVKIARSAWRLALVSSGQEFGPVFNDIGITSVLQVVRSEVTADEITVLESVPLGLRYAAISGRAKWVPGSAVVKTMARLERVARTGR